MTVTRPTTTVVGLISSNNEKAYLEEVANLSIWCQDNSLMLSVSKTKELIMDVRRSQHQRTSTPLGINGTALERVSSFRYLGVHIPEDLTWTTQIYTHIDRKAKQRLYQLKQLRKF